VGSVLAIIALNAHHGSQLANCLQLRQNVLVTCCAILIAAGMHFLPVVPAQLLVLGTELQYVLTLPITQHKPLQQ
jgi:hypothetical protein